MSIMDNGRIFFFEFIAIIRTKNFFKKSIEQKNCSRSTPALVAAAVVGYLCTHAYVHLYTHIEVVIFVFYREIQINNKPNASKKKN